MGHSMGGGASFLAVQFNAAITALATLAPAETNPSAINAAASILIPSLIIAGEKDCVTPPVSNQQPMYAALQSPCKTLVVINNGIHCQMANSNVLCNFGEATCLPSGIITSSTQHDIINRFLIPWLDSQLKNNCQAGAEVDSLIANDQSVVVTNACAFCNTTNSIVEWDIQIEIGPNPFSDFITVKCSDLNKYSFEWTDAIGNRIKAEVLMQNDVAYFKTSDFSKGIYFLQMKMENGKLRTFKLVKR